MVKQRRMISIGIVENSKTRTTCKLLEEILSLSEYNICYENKEKTILIFSKDNNHILLMDIKPNILPYISAIGIDFNILIPTFLDYVDYENVYLKNLLGNSEYILVNCDEERWTKLLENNTKSLAITYGFNNKATINLSSYNIHEIIEANICLQREIHAMNGIIIEPFELPIKINSKEKLDIYAVIATIVCGLAIGIDMFSINSYMFFNMENTNKKVYTKIIE